VGLTIEMMAAIGEQTLRGGFDMLKDDELTGDTARAPFDERVRSMVRLARRIEEQTGEKKAFIANVIEDSSKSRELADRAARAGADGVIVAPALQGLAVASEMARYGSLAVLSHNAGTDIATRFPRFGLAPWVMILLERLSGADMVFLPGDFGTAAADSETIRRCIEACTMRLGNARPSMPIVAGGKQPEDLRPFAALIGSPDFVVIAATALDTHPDGIQQGARAFREAWDTE
jgi:ribulose 1,5-bisphosphate carboxylase large subunit-like protein